MGNQKKKRDLWWWITRPVLFVVLPILALCIILELITLILYICLGYYMGHATSWIIEKIQMFFN